ncbi:hypothetical protein CspeluHIS016_0601010 [Cutaneotrichosporon spelunceum]|uniref:Gfo/Idh/MocA-like oxidoreductase N-terminal domain-containing protein n=1 Tax=Cutaneotrichosporon spelunceum TaxID=1672016 RepID=A0AAD3YE58_9TREE|nr:hypothetical protein CspeluHIS016_0601010 [Cutaneotrichosporon spelunceum]
MLLLRGVHAAPVPRLARTLLAPSYDRYVELPSHSGGDFDAVIVGAGYAMFGSAEGPWNMSRRAEVKLGPRLKVHAVIDPNAERAKRALAEKSSTFAAPSYERTVVLPSLQAYADKVRAGTAPSPKAIFVACPPQFRGGVTASNNLELEINKHFPDTNFFVEKPVSTGIPWQTSVEGAKEVGRVLAAKAHGVVGVGYCLRYLAAVQQMKQILADNNLRIMATSGRYIMTYELATKQEWWRNSGCQGPIIENGTHIADLSRYFGGDVDLCSLTTYHVEADEPPGQLSKMAFNDDTIALEDKIPRVTSTNWKYTSGAVGSILHGTMLQDGDYAIELAVYADGYQLILQDPYGVPSLSVRAPGQPNPEVYPTPGDDPYTTEISNFIDAIEGGPDPRILSSFEDAAKTYEFTWAIRNAGEAVTRKRRSRAVG